MSGNKPLEVRVPPELRDQIKQAANLQDKTVSEFIRDLATDYLEQHAEEIQKGEDARQALLDLAGVERNEHSDDESAGPNT